jgi:MGT family glycosyltransferase
MATLLFYNLPAHGHVNPSLPLVRELTARGHRVVYVMTEGYRSRIEAAGAEFRAYDPALVADDYFEARGLDGSRPIRTTDALLETTTALLPGLLAQVDELKPEAVIHDTMCLWGWAAAKASQRAHICSSSLMMLTPALLLGAPLALASVLAQLVGDFGVTMKSGRWRRELREKYQLDMPPTLVTRGDLTLAYTSALFQPGSAGMGADMRFIGPSVTARGDAVFPFDALDGRPLVYISLGTVINRNAPFFRACLAAFARAADVQVVLSLGRSLTAEALGDIPANAIVRDYVPQVELLRLPQMRLFITHGGLNSVHEGLYHDVPLLLAPQQDEQRMTAARVSILGAGRVLNDPTPAGIETAARLIMNTPSYREAAGRVGESLRTAGGPARGADEIEQFLQQKATA